MSSNKKRLLFACISIFFLAFLMEIHTSNAEAVAIDGGNYQNVVGIRFNNTDTVHHVGHNNLGGWVKFNVTGISFATGNCNETRIVNSEGTILQYQSFGQDRLNTSCVYGMLVRTEVNENVTFNLYYNASDADVTPSYPTYHYFEDGFEDGNAGGWGSPYTCTADTFPTNKPYAIGAYGFNKYDTNACASAYDKDIGVNFRWTAYVFPHTCGADTPLLGVKDAAGTGQNPDPLWDAINASCTPNIFVAGNHTDLSQSNFTLIEIGCVNAASCSGRLNYTHEGSLSFNEQDGVVLFGNVNPNNITWDEVNLWNYSVYQYPIMDIFSKAPTINITPSLFLCDGSGTEVFNFTFWQERTEEKIQNFSRFDGTFTAFTSSQRNFNNTFSFSVNNTAEVRICTDVFSGAFLDSHIEYQRPEYDKRFYYHFNLNLSGFTSSKISLYLLEIAFGDQIDFHVTDSVDEPLGDNVYVQVQRYDAGTGTYKIVAMLKPDSNGDDNTFLRKLDTWYRFIVIQENTVLMVSESRKIVDDDVYIRVPSSPLSSIVTEFENLAVSLSFNNITRNYTAIFTKTDGGVIEGCLEVFRKTAKQDTTICRKCENTSSATLICNIGSVNSTYVGTFFATINGITQTVRQLAINLTDGLPQKFKEDGLVLAIFIFMIMVFIGSWNPSVSIGLGVVGLVVAAMAGFFYTTVTIILGIVFLGGYLMYKTKT